MSTTVEVPKVGAGTVEDPYRPDIEVTSWRLVEDLATTMVIMIDED